MSNLDIPLYKMIMNKTIKNKIFLLLLIWGVVNSLFGKNINLEVCFPEGINLQRLSVYFDNGKLDKHITPVIKNNKWILTDSFFDRYATISFYYWRENDKGFVKGYKFWISEKPAKIIFNPKLKSLDNPITESNTVNAISHDDLYKKKVDVDIQQARLQIDRFLYQNIDSFDIQPQRREKFQTMVDSLALVDLKMISIHPNDYYFLYYYFNYVVLVRNSISAKEKLEFFRNTFPNSLKLTQLGFNVENALKSQINSKKGSESPSFKVLDINKKEYSSGNLKGKYILLDFWASWCLPCLQLTPKIQELREKYPENKLEIISISLDTEFASFSRALKKTNTSYVHVFGNQEIVKNYAVGPIPQYILIDPSGKVIYNKEQEQDTNIVKLQNLLMNLIKVE